MKIKLLFGQFSFLIGITYSYKERHIYIFPIPLFGILIKLKPLKYENNSY